jgi:hypothetical protein
MKTALIIIAMIFIANSDFANAFIRGLTGRDLVDWAFYLGKLMRQRISRA